MEQKPTGNASDRTGNKGFTWWELLILIVGFVVIAFMFMPTCVGTGERARRVNCLSNQNGMWNAASQWGLYPIQTWRPTFPDTNLATAMALDNAGITPEIFICPGAAWKKNSLGIHILGKNKEWGISAAPDLASVRANNCNYAYFGGREAENGNLVLFADKNGSNNIPLSPIAWGGNHGGQGGNVVRVDGRGFWVSTPSPSNDSLYCITNADVAAILATTGTVYTY